jgi:hypothetical protein
VAIKIRAVSFSVACALAVIGLAACGISRTVTVAGTATTTPGVTPPVVTTSVAPAADLASAKARWKALGATNYTFRYGVSCFCPVFAGVVTVKEGVVVTWKPDDDNQHAPKMSDVPTIDSLLARVDEAHNKATGDVKITYDPTNASIDWMKLAIDDEMSWTVADFTVLTR